MKKQLKMEIMLLFIILFLFPFVSFAENNNEKAADFTIPNYVLNIAKQNTAQNESSDEQSVEPSEEAKELLEQTVVPIENSELIQHLNETTIKPSPLAIGYRGEVYLGRWPLHYESEETSVNWEYQPINQNEYQNSGDSEQEMHYIQQETREIKGMLTNKIMDAEMVRKMMLQKAAAKTNLPLAYETFIGRNTKMPNGYPIPPEKKGILEAYATAVNEKGKVTFGEVYIELKGSNKALVIKNVTKQAAGAWIPIQDHVAYSFHLQ